MAGVFENILIMVLTIVVLLGGGYLFLVMLNWGLKIKSGSREQDGLTQLWTASQSGKPRPESSNKGPSHRSDN
jgi:hypothetical protein